jgi:hypothetical protein
MILWHGDMNVYLSGRGGGDCRCKRQVWYILEMTYFLYDLTNIVQKPCVNCRKKTKSGIIDRMFPKRCTNAVSHGLCSSIGKEYIDLPLVMQEEKRKREREEVLKHCRLDRSCPTPS